MDIAELLAFSVKNKASDLHLSAGLPPMIRVDGDVRRINIPALDHKQVHALVYDIMSDKQRRDYEEFLEVDFSFEIPSLARFRVNAFNQNRGAGAVFRTIPSEVLTLEDLACPPIFRELIDQPQGLILVTGPTGSGKSTTLYTLLNQINDEQRNIMTIEDPVEYELAGIAQTQVNPKVDMTFARGLRALLRQDPDVVLIGEIRDGETAQIAVQASLTGHLVLSTLHTNTAIGAVTRLRDMGVEPFLLSSSLSGVLAQRLVRRLCPHCREPYALPDAQRRQLGLASTRALTCWRPIGCEACGGQGYRGRIGLHELLVLDEPMRRAIHRSDGELDIARLAGERYQPLRQDGIAKMCAGETSLEEVLRVTREGDGDEV